MISTHHAEVDRTLASIAGQVDLLLDISPIDAEQHWDAWARSGRRVAPALSYRPLQTDVAGVRADLLALRIEGDDPLAGLLRAKRTDLLEEIDLIAARCTPTFLERSVARFGSVSEPLLAAATAILRRLDPPPPPDDLIGPQAFAELASAEVDRYRVHHPGLRASVSVRDDVSSLMVVHRDVIVGTDSWIPAARADALVHHEVGTHLLTAVNGGEQPLRLLEHGLARYEETQEALGVLAEHLVDGIDAERMVTLAARALGARRIEEGVGFVDLVAELHEEHGLAEHRAWTIAVRLVRAGGYTKDLIYLRGLLDLVDHLAGGGSLEPLLVGKLDLRDVGVVADLVTEGVLLGPTLRPRWLDGHGPAERLAALRRGDAPVDRWPLVAAPTP